MVEEDEEVVVGCEDLCEIGVLVVVGGGEDIGWVNICIWVR